MTSSIAWLDTTADEQRVVRELINLSTESESRDELGLGQIRDAFSETLFPGTSVIQTRARYFLIVPWIYRQGVQRGRTGAALRSWVEVRERRLIETLRAAGHTRGLIGRVAGPAVKILPSTIYWGGLVRYGILTEDVAPDHIGTAVFVDSESDELAGRLFSEWHPTLPPAPAGFPNEFESGFAMTAEESEWLTERILDTAPDSLLAYLLLRDSPPDPDSWAPWVDTACTSATADLRRILGHAELFSLTMHGAALLYNLLVGERYEEAGYTRISDPVEDYSQRLGQWAGECDDVAQRLREWDRGQMWQLVGEANRRVGLPTKLFVDTWIDAVVSGSGATAADDQSLRRLVADREKKKKMRQSRLINDRLLRQWSGASGSAPMTYRWPLAQTIVTDIHEGAGHAGA